MRSSSVRVECPTDRMDGVDSDDLTALPLAQLLPVLFLHRLNNMTEPVFYGEKKDRIRLSRVLSRPDRKSTRLNSSHANISYAVFYLKKKKNALMRALSDAPAAEPLEVDG